MGRVLLGILLGIVLVPLAVLGWLRFGPVPVAVADPPLPQERLLTGLPLHARIDSEMVKTPPIQADEANLVAGAEIYRDQCATCHGLHGKPSRFGAHMFPSTPPLWEKHRRNAAVGTIHAGRGHVRWHTLEAISGGHPTQDPLQRGVLSQRQRRRGGIGSVSRSATVQFRVHDGHPSREARDDQGAKANTVRKVRRGRRARSLRPLARKIKSSL